MTWKTMVAQVKTRAPGTMMAAEPTLRNEKRVSPSSVGYSTAAPRPEWGAAAGAWALRPFRANMEKTTLDVTHHYDMAIGDERSCCSGEMELTADEVAARLGTISYGSSARLCPVRHAVGVKRLIQLNQAASGNTAASICSTTTLPAHRTQKWRSSAPVG